jgi:hypothetical protein
VEKHRFRLILSSRFHTRELLHHGKWDAYLGASLDQNRRCQSRMFARQAASEGGGCVVADLSEDRSVEELEATV